MTREPMTEHELEATLADVGDRLAYPRPAAMADAVRARLREPRSRHWWDAFVAPRFGLVPALATLVLLVVAGALSSTTIADRFLRLPGIDIFRAPSVSTTPGPSATPRFPGQRVTLEQARAQAPFLRVPTDARLGTPDEVYLDQTPSGTQRVTLVYLSRAGVPVSPNAGVSAIVVALRGRVDEALFGKVAGGGTRIEDVSVNGGRGFWLDGAPHQFFYRDETGNIVTETLRLAGNTLLWEQDGVTFRLEAQVTREDAIRMAASFR